MRTAMTAMVLLFLVTSVSAEERTFRYETHIDLTASGGGKNELAAFTYTFDTEVPNSSGGIYEGWYQAITRATLQVGSDVATWTYSSTSESSFKGMISTANWTYPGEEDSYTAVAGYVFDSSWIGAIGNQRIAYAGIALQGSESMLSDANLPTTTSFASLANTYSLFYRFVLPPPPIVWAPGGETKWDSPGILTAVPEPSTYVLMLAGLAVLGASIWRPRRC